MSHSYTSTLIHGMTNRPNLLIALCVAWLCLNGCGEKTNPNDNILVTTFAGSTLGYADGNGTNAQFYYPSGISIGPDGVIYVADTWNNRIRKITSSGVVSTIAGGVAGDLDGQGTAAKFNKPTDVAMDKNGNLYVADLFNNKIKKITPDGMVTTIAGSTAGYQ